MSGDSGARLLTRLGPAASPYSGAAGPTHCCGYEGSRGWAGVWQFRTRRQSRNTTFRMIECISQPSYVLESLVGSGPGWPDRRAACANACPDVCVCVCEVVPELVVTISAVSVACAHTHTHSQRLCCPRRCCTDVRPLQLLIMLGVFPHMLLSHGHVTNSLYGLANPQ